MDKAQYHPAYFFPEKSGFETQILLCLSFFHVLCVSCHVKFFFSCFLSVHVVTYKKYTIEKVHAAEHFEVRTQTIKKRTK